MISALFSFSLDIGMMDSVNSTTFIKRPPCMTDEQEKLLYMKELLSGRIFLGYYQERRYVSALGEYRDVVIINSEETELQNDLDKLRQKWLGVKNIKWVGITGPDAVDLPKTYCFWVKLTNLAFDHYWFQIKYVKLINEEILLHLKCIRKFQVIQPGYGPCGNEKLAPQHKNETTEPTTSLYSSVNEIKWDFAKQAISAMTKACDDAIHTIMPHITWINFLKIVKVACALTIAFFMGTVTLIGHLAEYILRLIRELSLLVHAFAPIIIQLIDFFSKIFGGFFILLAGLFGKNVYRPNVEPHKNDFYSNNFAQTPAINWRERNQILRRELLSKEFRR